MDTRSESIAAIRISDAAYFFREVSGFRLTWTHEEQFDAVAIYSSTEIEGWHVLAFRGTEEGADWRVTANVWPLLDMGGGAQAHRGYGLAWQALKDDVLAQLAKLNISHLTVTGHSLGGALATLAAADLPPGDLHLITFGNPRATNQLLAEVIGQTHRVTRYVHGNDLCPLYPLGDLHHVAPAVQLGERGWWLYASAAADHKPFRYARALGYPMSGGCSKTWGLLS